MAKADKNVDVIMNVLPELRVGESPFTRYLASLLPVAIIVIGGLQFVLDNPGNWIVITQFALLIVGTATAYLVKLVPDSRWQGRAKTGAQLITVVLTALVPFLLPGGFDPSVSVTLIVVAVLNAIATEFGVQVRNDASASSLEGLGEVQVITDGK